VTRTARLILTLTKLRTTVCGVGRDLPVRSARATDGLVTRAEFDEMRRTVDECNRTLKIQFQRIAQMQAELDHIRTAETQARTRKKR
jgi:hypothetical protein